MQLTPMGRANLGRHVRRAVRPRTWLGRLAPVALVAVGLVVAAIAASAI